MGFKLMAGAVASCALIGVAVGVGIIYGSLLISIGRNPSQRDELLRYAFIGFSLVEVSGLIGLVISLLLLFGFDRLGGTVLVIIILSAIHLYLVSFIEYYSWTITNCNPRKVRKGTDYWH